MLQLVFAWFAAGAFAASLGFFLYTYLVSFREPPFGLVGCWVPGAACASHVAVATLWNVILFTIFALHHSLFARSRIKALVRAHIPAALERSVYTLVASVLFVCVCWWWVEVPGRAWRLEGIWRWLGYAIQSAGIVIAFVGSRALDVLDLAGVRQAQGTSTRHAPLETRGIYGLVRHPLYFGWTLLVFGTPDMTATRLVFAAVSTLYLVIAIPFEERSLIETFGADYASYQRKVRWRMLPWLY